jgi:hypothetical protein
MGRLKKINKIEHKCYFNRVFSISISETTMAGKVNSTTYNFNFQCYCWMFFSDQSIFNVIVGCFSQINQFSMLLLDVFLRSINLQCYCWMFFSDQSIFNVIVGCFSQINIVFYLVQFSISICL